MPIRAAVHTADFDISEASDKKTAGDCWLCSMDPLGGGHPTSDN